MNDCKHDTWTQKQEFMNEDWRCAGCGMWMPAAQMLIWRELQQLRAAAGDTSTKEVK